MKVGRKPHKNLTSNGPRIDQDLLNSRLGMETLLQELAARRADDPLLNFEPNPGAQREFILSVLLGQKAENFLLGANRCGKSDAGAYIGATLARFGYPEDSPYAAKWVKGQNSQASVKDRATSGWVSALDFPTSRETVQPKYFDNGYLSPSAHRPFVPEREIAEWRVSEQVLRLKNGSMIGFKSADSGRTKYQGTEKHWIHLDEEHPQDIYEEVCIRVGTHTLNIFTTATLLPPPGQIGGVGWLYRYIVAPWKQGKKPEIGIFNSSIYDNPHIPRAEIERLETKWPVGSVQARIRLGGELLPGMSGTRAYGSFDRLLNVRAQSALPEMSSRRPLCWIWDFNVEPMVSLIGQSRNDRQKGMLHIVYNEVVLDEGGIADMVEQFRLLYPSWNAPVIVYGDASGHDRSHQSRKTSYTMILNEMRNYGAPVQVRVPSFNPAQTARIDCVNQACRRPDGAVSLLVDETCEELIADLESVLCDPRGGIKKSNARKDPYYRRTHTSDALGYWLSWEAPVVAIMNDDARELKRIRRPGYERS